MSHLNKERLVSENTLNTEIQIIEPDWLEPDFKNISMGQGQEKPAEAVVAAFAKNGGWVRISKYIYIFIQFDLF